MASWDWMVSLMVREGLWDPAWWTWWVQRPRPMRPEDCCWSSSGFHVTKPFYIFFYFTCMYRSVSDDPVTVVRIDLKTHAACSKCLWVDTFIMVALQNLVGCLHRQHFVERWTRGSKSLFNICSLVFCLMYYYHYSFIFAFQLVRFV